MNLQAGWKHFISTVLLAFFAQRRRRRRRRQRRQSINACVDNQSTEHWLAIITFL